VRAERPFFIDRVMEVPPEKKQKTDEAAANDAEMTEEKKAPEPPKENEVDAKPLKGKPVEGVDFLVPDTTVNIMSSTAGNLLRTLQDNGLQYLLAGARASVGIKSGRYMFEVQIVESPTVPDGPYPRNSLKIGVSIAGSSLLLDSEESSVSFDSDVYFAGNKKGGKALPSLRVGDVVACLINLDKGSPNHNTLSLFKNGTRVAEPKALPKKLHGTPLFPSVAFKSTTLHMNFGPDPICPLPFTCHMVGSALQSHAEVTTYDVPDSGEVLFPVSLPDEGSFDWLDMYLEKNPGCIEISDRAIREWVEKSAAWPWRKVTMSSKDKPEMGFGIPQIDNGSAKKALITFCTLQRRKYVVMEVKGNLVKEDRALALEPFKSANFKTSAVVLVGTPPNEFKKRSQALLLKEKQAASDKEHNDKFENTMKKWLFDKKQKELEKARKKAAKDREKAAKARAKAIEEAKKQAAVATEGKENEEKKAQDEQKEEEPEEEEPEEEEPMEPEPVKEDPPKVALTPEEKKLSFKPPVIPDLTQYVLNTTFAKFSLPEKVDGFDTLQYEFLKDGGKCQEYVQEWISSRKLTTRVEDIKPSARFHAVKKNWDKSLQDWLRALAQYKSNVAKKLADKAAKEAKKKMAAAKAAAKAAAAKATDEAEKKNGEEKKEEKEEEKKEDDVVEEVEDDDEEPEPVVDLDDIEAFAVDDVKDVGGGMPLYAKFGNEDWTLLILAFELHLLAHSFKWDVNDEDRTGMHVDHVGFYYQKYFNKPFNPKAFGKDTVKDVIELVKDVVCVDGKGVVVNRLQGEMESYQVFVKITEEIRRFRAIRIDLGEESAVLRFTMQPLQSLHHGQKRKPDWQPPQGPGGWGPQSWGPAGKKGKGKGWSK